MRILVVHNAGRSDLPSGETSVVNDEVKSLSNAGHDVQQLTASNDEITGKFKLLMTGFNVFWSFSAYQRIEKILLEFRPQIVHFHGILPLLTPSVFFACKKHKVAVVQTIHNCRYLCVEGALFRNDFYCDLCPRTRNSLHGILHRCSRGSFLISLILTIFNRFYIKSGLLFNVVDRFIAVSEFIANLHIEQGFPSEKFTVKQNGIDFSMLHDDEKSAENGSATVVERKEILFVGRLVPAKGTQILCQLMQRFSDTVFNIVGEGPELEKLKRFVQDKSLTNVILHGKKPFKEIVPMFYKATCLLIPSVCGESFGRIAVEGMLYQTPIVASDLGGLGEIVRQSGAGICVDPTDIEGFVQNIQSLLNSEAKRTELGKKGREYAKKFALDAKTQQLIELYEEVIRC